MKRPRFCAGISADGLTVDGSEIRRSPVGMVNIQISHYFTRFYTCQSVHDFFHQQYDSSFCCFMFKVELSET